MKTRQLTIGVATLGAWLFFAGPVVAQGNGKGNAFGHGKTTASAVPGAATTSAGSAPGGVPSAEITGVRNFASWLDDASIIEPGSGVMSFSAGYWRMAGFSELDLPSFDVGLGIAKHVQAGASVPVYHAGAPGGPVARGLGDLYLNAKVQLREPSAGPRQRIGVALVPLVQVLSAEPAIGESRVSWGLPVAIEMQRSGWPRGHGSPARSRNRTRRGPTPAPTRSACRATAPTSAAACPGPPRTASPCSAQWDGRCRGVIRPTRTSSSTGESRSPSRGGGEHPQVTSACGLSELYSSGPRVQLSLTPAGVTT